MSYLHFLIVVAYILLVAARFADPERMDASRASVPHELHLRPVVQKEHTLFANSYRRCNISF